MLQKFLYIIISFLLGIFFVILGAFFKITHFSNGNLFLLLGMLFKSLALILLIIKIVKQPKKEKI
ncbi:MAG: gliding motility protein GldL [Bacteroidetes bacterium HGW-Bacteroidetes-23]|nr:MAG: gliding motility protein GldL [Bacteroidetes bacterium HGW-Bacteroidetes-23]